MQQGSGLQGFSGTTAKTGGLQEFVDAIVTRGARFMMLLELNVMLFTPGIHCQHLTIGVTSSFI